MAQETIPLDQPIWEIVFSREYLFYQNKIRGGILGITFKTGSEAARNFGLHITVKLVFTREEIEELVTNYGDKKDTYGVVSAKIRNPDFTDEPKEVTFHTDDILEICQA